ncbi:metal-sensitive transcriptional regulator [Hydrogenophaga sp.]|uniref:metal-sensitive transcriptional regulator n=1 Tax=Hydrogenophaga sp. TaxID=1904254 RepID=UPI003F708390
MTASLVPSPLPTPSRPVSVLQSHNGVRTEHQREVINRLKRIEGQVRGLIEMVDNARPCEDVAQQMSAARKAMDKAFYRMIACTVMEAVSDSASEVEAFREVERSTRILEKYA